MFLRHQSQPLLVAVISPSVIVRDGVAIIANNEGVIESLVHASIVNGDHVSIVNDMSRQK